ncbi:MAG: hypothetical protein EP330_24695 [Deltaproteobacteria bacterium]|nr:MAG: hypothetical protein EP330_24695 [Deltaproteobacteria bacterium]
METRHRIPNANSPELLARLLELVASGVRSPRALTEALGLESRTVRYYVQAALWLGLAEEDGELSLTSDGVEYVYAGSARGRVYARVVRAHPFVIELLGRSGGRFPELADVEFLVGREEPELAPTTVRRRASAVRSLISPAIGKRARRNDEDRQLGLPFVSTPRLVDAPAPLGSSTAEYDPDVYRFVLGALLDYGELRLPQVRALLDHAGATEAPLGGYVDLAMSRGDALRHDEQLIVSPGAILRRDIAESTASVLLSDTGYRRWVIARTEDPLSPPPPEVARYRAWDKRLFGREVPPEDIDRELDRVLMDRSLASFPVAVPGEEPLRRREGCFVDRWEQEGLIVALPPSLVQLSGGVSLINSLLRKARTGAVVGVPDLAHRAVSVHGGLLAPGETLPRSVPDTRSLRLRLLASSPYVTMLIAMLLLHRRQALPVSLSMWHGGWVVRRKRQSLGGFLKVFDAFALSRGWLPSRRRTGGMEAARLLDVLETIGMITHTGDHVVLAEGFFGQLRREAEEMELATRLEPMVEAMASWIAAVEPVEDL